jgi:hypothetical protein
MIKASGGKMKFATAAHVNLHLMLSAALGAALSILPPAAEARSKETVSSKPRPGQVGGGGGSQATWDYLKDNASEAKQDSFVVLEGNATDLSKSIKSTKDVVTSECSHSGSGGLCDYKDKATNVFEAASQATGIPGAVLACTAKLESSFGRSLQNPTSSAKGIGQFIDGTAEQVEKKMKDEANWKAVFEKYKEVLAKQNPPITSVPAFTKANIQNTNKSEVESMMPTSIFAIAILARDGISEAAEKTLANNPEHFLDFIAMVHVEGAEMAKKFMQNGFDLSKTPVKNRSQAEKRLKDMKDCAKKST